MKQFILNNKPYSKTDRQDLFDYYLSIGCIEVPKIYNENYTNPIWNGMDFIEGATPEEIAANVRSRSATLRICKRLKRLP